MIGSMFSGYGGLDMAVAPVLSGDVAWHVEIDPDATKVLEQHWPGIVNHGDTRLVDWRTVEPVNVLAAGAPCQPVSAAGRQLLKADPRWLWPELFRAVHALQPEWVAVENVRNLISARKDETWRDILDELNSRGYDVAWLTLGACAVGAPHHRHRVFALARRAAGRRGTSRRIETMECGAPRTGGRALLPTPVARDGDPRQRGEGSPEFWTRKLAERGGEGMPLGAAVRMLPAALDGERWGPYCEAVVLWEHLTRPAPKPTEPNSRKGSRLAPALPEWMMGLPGGFLTNHVGRPAALRLAGNGVLPLQGKTAFEILQGALS